MSAMSGDRFSLDANVLFYVFDAAERSRQETAIQIVGRARALDCILTVQTVGEFYWAASRKLSVPRTILADQADNWMTVFPVVMPTGSTVRRAIAGTMDRRFSYWDAMLLATAADAGCTAVLSEDMADGATLAGVTVIHPFAADGGIAPAAAAVLGLSA